MTESTPPPPKDRMKNHLHLDARFNLSQPWMIPKLKNQKLRNTDGKKEETRGLPRTRRSNQPHLTGDPQNRDTDIPKNSVWTAASQKLKMVIKERGSGQEKKQKVQSFSQFRKFLSLPKKLTFILREYRTELKKLTTCHYISAWPNFKRQESSGQTSR